MAVDDLVTTAFAPTEIERKIFEQIEYYFGDINLPKDKFLQTELKKDDGWIPIETMLLFNRLKQLTTDTNDIVKALEKSPNHLMEINSSGTKIRRSLDRPLPCSTADYWNSIKKRSLYVKGFPKNIALDEIQLFFKSFGQIDSVYMRRYKDDERTFKGSVFVTFHSKEDTDRFISSKHKYEDAELECCVQEEYYMRKAIERKKAKDEKKAEKESAKRKQIEDAQKKAIENITRGLILHLSGIPTGPDVKLVRRESIYATFEDLQVRIAWIDYLQGKNEAFVRFEGKENSANLAIEKLKEKNDGKVVIAGHELPFRVLEGDEEISYWKGVVEAQHHARTKKKEGGGGRKRALKWEKRPLNRKTKFEDDVSAEKATGKETNEEDESLIPRKKPKTEIKEENGRECDV